MILFVRNQYEEEEEESASCNEDKGGDDNDFDPPPSQQFQWDWNGTDEENCSRFQEIPGIQKMPNGVVGSNLRHELEAINIRKQELNSKHLKPKEVHSDRRSRSKYTRQIVL